MSRIASRQEFVADVDALIDAVRDTHDPVIVEENGQPVAVFVSPADYDYLRMRKRQEAWRGLDGLRERTADLDPDEVLADVTQVVDDIRQETGGRDTR